MVEENEQKRETHRLKKRFGRRYFLFRAAAILVGLFPLLLFELSLHVIGWQEPGGVVDPYVGFTEIRPLFERNEQSGRFEIAPSRQPLFCPASFLIDKPDNGVRIFCIGGSTVQGRPFEPATSFTQWLQLSLETAAPSTHWEVVNCGGVSYASYRLAPIVEEVMAYQPDLIVLYTGQNEFLEDRTYQSIKSTPQWLIRTHERLSTFKTYAFLRSCVVNSPAEETTNSQLPTEVEARLDFQGGLAKYQRNNPWQQSVIQHFEHNLHRIVKAARQVRVPIVICNPVSNLKDAAPFKSQNGELTAEQQSQFDQLWQSAMEFPANNAQEEFDVLSELANLDPIHADVQFRLGQAHIRRGNTEQALLHLIRAKDEDVCPLRILSPMYDVIDSVCTQHDVPLLDVKKMFEDRAGDGIPGRESLIDHVHPTIHGHQLVADLLLDWMVDNQWIKLDATFPDRQAAVYQSHLESLPNIYFELGKDRLAGLKRWAEGRVTRKHENLKD